MLLIGQFLVAAVICFVQFSHACMYIYIYILSIVHPLNKYVDLCSCANNGKAVVIFAISFHIYLFNIYASISFCFRLLYADT